MRRASTAKLREMLALLCAVCLPVSAAARSTADIELPRRLLDVHLTEHEPGLEMSAWRSDAHEEGVPDAESPWELRKWLPLVALIGVTLGVGFGVDSPDEPRWDSRNDFDDSARSALRASTESGRNTAATMSTVFVATNAALLAGDWALERDLYSPIESLRVDATWVMASQVANLGTKLAAARGRPYLVACEQGDHSSDCTADDRYMSFYSGHTALSSTFAGLLCSRRLHRPERRGQDYLMCAGASSLALATGFLRISSDDHWMTDTLMGWGTGVIFGYFLPSVFHYQHESSRIANRPPTTYLLTPIAGTRTWGLRYQVLF